MNKIPLRIYLSHRYIHLLFLIGFLTIPSLSAYTQGKPVTEYYTANWKPCNKEKCAYYRIISYNAEGLPQGTVHDYYKNGKKCWEGEILSFEPYQVFNGICTWYYENGRKQESGTYRNGLKEGEFLQWFENGKPRTRGNYINNLREGLYTWYYSSGAKNEEAFFIHGKKEGANLEWYEHGELKKKAVCHNGVLDGYCIYFYENGDVLQKATYHNNKKEGEYTAWDKKRILRAKLNYLHDTLEGTQYIYNASSVLTEKSDYHHGQQKGPRYSYDDSSRLYYMKHVTIGTLKIDWWYRNPKTGSTQFNETDTSTGVQIAFATRNSNLSIEKSKYFKDNSSTQITSWADNGEKIKSYNKNRFYQDTTWYSNGKIKNVHWHKGRNNDSIYEEWDINGKLVNEFIPKTGFVRGYKDNTQCLYGIKDKNNKKISPLKYMMVYEFRKGKALVQGANEKYGLIDIDGNEVIPTIYDNLEYFDKEGSENMEEGFGETTTNFSKDTGSVYFIAEFNKKSGIIDAQNKTIIPLRYDNINSYGSNPPFITINDGLYGFGNIKGVILEPTYLFLDDNPDGIFFMVSDSYNKSRKHNIYGVVDSTGKLIIPVEYDTIYFNKRFPKLIGVMKKHKFGIFNQNGKVILPLEYQFLDDKIGIIDWVSDKGNQIFLQKEGKVGWMNSNGEWYVKPCHDTMGKIMISSYYNSGAIIFGDKNKYGILDTLGKIHIPAIYESIQKLNPPIDYHRGMHNIYIVKKNGKFGLIDAKNNTILPFKYDDYYVTDYFNNLYLIRDGRISSFSWFTMNETSEPENLYFDSTGIAEIRNLNDKLGAINSDRQLLVKPDDDNIQIKNGTIRTYNNKENQDDFKEIFFDGKPVIRHSQYAREWKLKDKYRCVLSRAGKAGILNPRNKLILDTIYQAIYDYNPEDSGFWVMRDTMGNILKPYTHYEKKEVLYFKGNWAFANANGKFLTDWVYDEPVNFHHSFALSLKNGKPCLLRKKDGTIQCEIFDTLRSERFDLYYFSKNKTKGLMDSMGNIIVSGNWDNYYGFFGSYAIYYENGHPGLIDSTGKIHYNAAKKEMPLGKINLEKIMHFSFSIPASCYSCVYYYWHNSEIAKKIIRNYEALNKIKDTTEKIFLSNMAILEAAKGRTENPYNYNIRGQDFTENDFYSTSRPENISYFLMFKSALKKPDSAKYKSWELKINSLDKNIFGVQKNITEYTDIATAGHSEMVLQRYFSQFENFSVNGNSLRLINYKELFDTTQDYKSKMNRIMTLGIKKLEDVDLSCHKSGNYFDLLKDKFIIKEKGLCYYLENNYYYERDYDKVELLIPWSEIKSFINTKGPLKEFIK